MRALITGITGQDGSYLAELLLRKGYKVYGIYRRQSIPKFDRIEHIKDRITLIEGDVTDMSSLIRALEVSKPTEIYNLASQSFVGTSWKQPIQTMEATGLSVLKLLEAVRLLSFKPKILQASSSEMFGKVKEIPQKETTPFSPRSPYGIAKVMAYWTTVNYRESYDMFISNSICFNHESIRRGIEFVTRKVTWTLARIANEMTDKLFLGNIYAKRDWGYAPDYVEAMYMILQQDKPEDYVVATGENHSIMEFLDIAFTYCDLDWNDYVVIDKSFFRPTEVDELVGDNTKIKKLGWQPSIPFKELVELMVEQELGLIEKQ